MSGRAAYGINGTASAAEVWHEVMDCHELLSETLNVTPTWFRSGTAHYDDVGVAIARRCGYGVAGFSVNLDAGATAPRAVVRDQLASARDGDILLAHMNQPGGQSAEGIADGLAIALDRGLTFRHLPAPRLG
ncbi:MAG: hypothetical protein Q4P36_05280 [Bowdeniella nasicola]|nr:hypothetical protein [Bowdeniella nasicola]